MDTNYRVNVYDENKDVVTRVRYNSCLDFWDGRNFSSGKVGRHLGITKMKDGRYVLIHGTQWLGEKDYGELVSEEQAIQAILKTQHIELFKTKKFKQLKAIALEKGLIGDTEDEDDEEEEEFKRA